MSASYPHVPQTARPALVRETALQTILHSQRSDGAWTLSSTDRRVIPYFNHFVANGLAMAASGRATVPHQDAGSQSPLPELWLHAVDGWLAWYRDHMRENGVVNDYVAVPTDHPGMAAEPLLEDTGDCDSTDSYAAFFLIVLWNRFVASGEDLHYLTPWVPYISKATEAMALTEDDDGLTYAKPGWSKKYLMDNSEVFVGYLAAARLNHVLGESVSAAKFRVKAQQMKETLESRFWQPGHNCYSYAHDKDGTFNTRMQVWYPDVLSNIVYLALCGEPDNAKHRRHYLRLWEDFYATGMGAPSGVSYVEHSLWWLLAAGTLGLVRHVQSVWAALTIESVDKLPMSILGHLVRATLLVDEVERGRDSLKEIGRGVWLL